MGLGEIPMGLGRDLDRPGERSRWALGQIPDGPWDKSPVGLGSDPQWAWGQIPMGLRGDPGCDSQAAIWRRQHGWEGVQSVLLGFGGQGDGRQWQGG